MGLIDRKNLINEMESHIYWGDSAVGLLEVAKNAHAIDAVEVVRCRECKHWGTAAAGETDHVKQCEYGGYMVGESGYCVYGEMKKDEK